MLLRYQWNKEITEFHFWLCAISQTWFSQWLPTAMQLFLTVLELCIQVYINVANVYRCCIQQWMYIISQCSTLYSNCTSHPGADHASCLLRIKSHYYYSNCAHEECWSKPSARAILWQGSTLQCMLHKDTLWLTFTITSKYTCGIHIWTRVPSQSSTLWYTWSTWNGITWNMFPWEILVHLELSRDTCNVFYHVTTLKYTFKDVTWYDIRGHFIQTLGRYHIVTSQHYSMEFTK